MPAHARKNMEQRFPFSGESNDSSAEDALVKETAALYLDPRNRLIAHGPDSLTELDTLTLLLGQRDHLLATRLLLSFGSLTALARASLAQLTPPLSAEKAMRLVCAFRLGALCASRQAATNPLDSPEHIYNLFSAELMQMDREVICVALLDARFRLLKKVRISVGTLNEALAHPREILKAVIYHSAYAFVLVHNHPSGDAAPSESDTRLTRQLNEAAKVLQIRFLDHVIVGQAIGDRDPYFSFKRAGLL
jgi:DNA repair protein RadC